MHILVGTLMWPSFLRIHLLCSWTCRYHYLMHGCCCFHTRSVCLNTKPFSLHHASFRIMHLTVLLWLQPAKCLQSVCACAAKILHGKCRSREHAQLAFQSMCLSFALFRTSILLSWLCCRRLHEIGFML